MTGYPNSSASGATWTRIVQPVVERQHNGSLGKRAGVQPRHGVRQGEDGAAHFPQDLEVSCVAQSDS